MAVVWGVGDTHVHTYSQVRAAQAQIITTIS